MMSSAKSVRESRPAADRQSPAEGNVRGAGALIRAVSGARAGIKPVEIKVKGGVSARDRKIIKKAGQTVRQAVEALDTRRYKAAEMLFDQAIAVLDTVPPSLWCYRLVAAAKAANYEYVVDNYKRIRALVSSEDEEVVVDRTWVDCLVAAGFYQEALRDAEALSARYKSAAVSMKTVIGVIHAKLGNLDEAIAIQKSVLQVEPSHALARWNLAIHQLEAGHLPEAFENYEARWDWSDFPSERRIFDIPRWKGEKLDGKRILVWREQGIGDELRFSGILPDLIAVGARITFECSAKLVALFRASFPGVDVRAEPPAATGGPQDYRNFDFEVPIGSLARVFRPTVAEMQARCRPWLKRDTRIENEVRADMKLAPQQPLIGISWRSTNRNVQRNQHYVKAEYLAPLKLLGASKFLCVQYDDCREEVALMRELGLPVYDFPNIDQMNDLVSASYLVGACDLVISAPTTTAELSAGLGVPTIMFGLKHSHIQLGTNDVPWHPASRYLTLDPDDPMSVSRSVLMDWKDIAAWADRSSTSGRPTNWQLSFPGAG
jgi:hypothetical protein